MNNPKIILYDDETAIIPDYTLKSPENESRMAEIMQMYSQTEIYLLEYDKSLPMKGGKSLLERFTIDFLIKCALKKAPITKNEISDAERMNQIKIYYCMAAYSKRRYDDEKVFSALRDSCINAYSQLKEKESKEYISEIIPKEFLEYVKNK